MEDEATRFIPSEKSKTPHLCLPRCIADSKEAVIPGAAIDLKSASVSVVLRMASVISKIRKLQENAQSLWDEKFFRAGDEPSGAYKFLHFWVLVVKSFGRNRCPVRAAALSYSTLLALIPILAVALGVTSSLLKDEGEDRIGQFIGRFVASVIPPADTTTNAPAGHYSKPPTPLPPNVEADPPRDSETNSRISLESSNVAAAGLTNVQSETAGETATTSASDDESTETQMSAAQRVAAREINSFIQSTRSGTLGVTGTVVLIFVAIRMLSRIEETFNDIWGVTCGRSWPMRIVMYWATITLGPILLAAALGLSGGAHFEATRGFFTDMPIVGNLVLPSLTLIIIWVAFAMFYKAVPNTKVAFSAALVGGCVAGTLWHLNNVFGFLYVSRVVTNREIYGSLGLVPVFMAGLFVSWIIMLFGAQVSYAFQNRALYLQNRLAENVNQRGKEFVALRLMTCIGQRFQRGMPPPSVQVMSEELGIPSRLIQQVLQTLVAAHLVLEIAGADPAYTPARPLEDITAHHLLQAMRATQGQELKTRNEPIRAEVYGEFARIQEAEKQAASALTMLALVTRAQARLELTPAPPTGDEVEYSTALKPSASDAPVEHRAAPREPVQAAPEKSEAPAAINNTDVDPVGQPDDRAKPAAEEAATHETVEPAADEDRTFPL
jgi:membrane protein